LTTRGYVSEDLNFILAAMRTWNLTFTHYTTMIMYTIMVNT
jgi:hypothetical protein